MLPLENFEELDIFEGQLTVVKNEMGQNFLRTQMFVDAFKVIRRILEKLVYPGDGRIKDTLLQSTLGFSEYQPEEPIGTSTAPDATTNPTSAAPET